MTATAHAGAVVGAGVPFSAGELDDALAARDAAADVEVLAITPARVQVVAGADRWDVELGGAHGRVAARLVALHVVERGAPGSDLADLAPPTPAKRGKHDLFTLYGGLASGLEPTDLTSTLIGFDGATTGPIWWSAHGGVQRSLGTDPDPGDPVHATLIKLSVLIGIRRGPVEVGAGPTLGGLLMDGVQLDRYWLFGACAVARARWTIAGPWSITAGVDATAFDHRVEVRASGETIASTPRVALDWTLGITRELSR
jgi:hypothetical protein